MTDSPPPAPKKQSLIRSSMIFAALTLVSRFMGFARDLVVTAKIGAAGTIAADAYYTALAFPNLFRRIFAEGAFAAAFVPAYSKKLAGDGDGDADRFAADALATVAFASVVVCTVCMLAMPWIMRVYSGGYLDDPEKFRLTWILTTVTMPYLSCMVIAAVFSGILNARGRFIVSGAYPTILNAVMLALIWPQTDPVDAAWAGAIGVVIAGIGQAAICWWGAKKSGARIRLVKPSLSPEMKRLVKTAVPAVIGNSATQINITISMILAAQVDGMRAWMNVADRLYQLPMSLIGVAIGIALLPRLSHAIRTEDHADAQTAMDQAMVFGLALCLPAAAALVVLPVQLMDGLFARGEFTFADAEATGRLLLHYGWGVPAFVLLRILQPAFFARGETRAPMVFSLVSVAVNVALGVALFYTIGFIGIPIATSTAAWISIAMMAASLWRNGVYRPDGRAVAKIVRVAAASAAMGAVLLVIRFFYGDVVGLFGDFRLAKEAAIVLVCAVGGLLYPVLLFAFGGVTPAEAKAALRRRKSDAAPTSDLP